MKKMSFYFKKYRWHESGDVSWHFPIKMTLAESNYCSIEFILNNEINIDLKLYFVTHMGIQFSWYGPVLTMLTVTMPLLMLHNKVTKFTCWQNYLPFIFDDFLPLSFGLAIYYFTYPGFSSELNISCNGNCRWISFLMSSIHLESPSARRHVS